MAMRSSLNTICLAKLDPSFCPLPFSIMRGQREEEGVPY